MELYRKCNSLNFHSFSKLTLYLPISRNRHDGGFKYRIKPEDGLLHDGDTYYFSLFVRLLNNATTTNGYCTVDIDTKFKFDDSSKLKLTVAIPL